MTEQEAEMYAAQLTRIWGSEENALIWRIDTDNTSQCVFHFEKTLPEGLLLQGWREDPTFYMTISDPHSPAFLEYSEEGFYHLELPQVVPFARRWMPFFRRNCWLSGCSIEATAHEKAEWIQGFTREEIGAWNLKI